jgi:uridylate kinase
MHKSSHHFFNTYISYDRALELDLAVMDLSAVALAKDQSLPLFVCHLDDIGDIGIKEVM